MGTNFYTLRGEHVGKRSAAGTYCWDCHVPFTRNGNEALVHEGNEPQLEACPSCGAPRDRGDTMDTVGNPVAVELGFAKPRTVVPSGVSGASSFTWAMPEGRVKRLRKIKDEYGRTFTIVEFQQMLAAQCPIRYELFGVEFS